MAAQFGAGRRNAVAKRLSCLIEQRPQFAGLAGGTSRLQ